MQNIQSNKLLASLIFIHTVLTATISNHVDCSKNINLWNEPEWWRDQEQQQVNRLSKNEIYVIEDKDYPKFLFENYTGVGQVSGITVLPTDDLAIFHRSDRPWTANLINEKNQITIKQDKHERKSDSRYDERLINQDAIMILNRDDGSAITTFGSNLFSMPHGIASDSSGNLWITDVGLHQVMRFPVAQSIQFGDWSRLSNSTEFKPDIVLGKAFEPGSDNRHFCMPAEIKISSRNGLIFVADGYCNHRIMVFNSRGEFIKSLGEDIFPPRSVIHSLTLLEKRNMICAAAREIGNIYCLEAGLDGHLESMGNLITVFKYPFGKVYAIVDIGPNHLLVSSQRFDSPRFDMATLHLVSGQIRPTWISGDLLEPHSMSKTNDGSYVYVADVSPNSFKKVFQFKIIKGRYM